MINAIIIDDEKSGAEVLQTLLKQYCEEICIVDIAYSITSAIASVKENKPDLVFLDIEMPVGTGFDILKATQYLEFETIFTTAYENYAVKAFKTDATDYLLKPIDVDELKTALHKVSKRIAFKKSIPRKTDGSSQEVIKISIPSREGYLRVDVNEIIRLEAESNYTNIFMRSKKKFLISKTLKSFEELLPETHFFRVHSSHLINLNEVDRYMKGDGGTLILKDSARIPVSRANKAELLRRLDLK